jgi:integrase
VKTSMITHTYDQQSALARVAPALEHARQLIDDSLPPNTKRAYESWWARFSAWFEDLGGAKGSAIDATPEVVASFLADLDLEGVLPQSLACAYSGISFFLRAKHEETWPSGHRPFVVARVLKGAYQRNGRPAVKKKAITPLQLAQICSLRQWPEPIGARNRALLLLGFTGAFRRSELVAIQKEHLSLNKVGLRVLIPRSKTDQKGQGQEIGIARDPDPKICPVVALRTWLFAGQIASGYVFRACSADGCTVFDRGLQPQAAADVVKQAVEMLGLDPRQFAGHSLRRGFVTTAARQGTGLDSIMRHTRHKSERQAREYIEAATLFENNASVGVMRSARRL